MSHPVLKCLHVTWDTGEEAAKTGGKAHFKHQQTWLQIEVCHLYTVCPQDRFFSPLWALVSSYSRKNKLLWEVVVKTRFTLAVHLALVIWKNMSCLPASLLQIHSWQCPFVNASLFLSGSKPSSHLWPLLTPLSQIGCQVLPFSPLLTLHCSRQSHQL